MSLVPTVPRVPGEVLEPVVTVLVEPVLTICVVPRVAGDDPVAFVIVVLKVPDEVCELPVLVSGPLEEPEVEADVLLVDGGGVSIHLHALLTLSVLFWHPPM